MMYGDPISSLAQAVHSALLRDLPDVKYIHKTPDDRKHGRPGVERVRRPRMDEVFVYHFQQTWGDTSLGFAEVGGQALTSAYTTVVTDHRSACVYFAGIHAYTVQEINNKFMEDVKSCDMAGKWDVTKYAYKKSSE